MKLIKGLFFILLATVVVIVGMSAWYAPEGFPEGSVTDQRASKVLFEIDTLALALTDTSRVTQSNKDAAQKPNRTFQGVAYYPKANGERQPAAAPLIIFSHGFSSSYRGGEYLGRYLAGLGYVVAMVDFPMTNMSADGGPFVKDVVNQPGDVRFLIDQLLNFALQPEHELHNLIDPERIGVMGVSLGGFTSTLIGFHPTMSDERIDSVISIAGPTYFLTPRFFENRDLPFMMIGGTYDVLVPYESNAANIQDKDSDAWLVGITAGAHTAFSGPTAALRFLDNVDVIGCWAVLRSIEGDMDEPWYDLLGDESTGIDVDAEVDLCTRGVPESAMNVVQQQWITQVLVGAFFDMTLSTDAVERAEAERFLRQTIGAELPEVVVTAPKMP